MDLYEQIDEIAQGLHEAGREDWAEPITDDVEGGATGTEILMAVRWHLQQLRNEPGTLPDSLAARIDDTVQGINTALG